MIRRRVSLGGGNQANINGIHKAVITSALLYMYGPNGWATRTRSYGDIMIWDKVLQGVTNKGGGKSLAAVWNKRGPSPGTIKPFKWPQPR